MSNLNPFEELAELEDKQDKNIKAPPHLRHKIFGTYHLVTGVFKVLELFLSNAVNTALNMVSLVSEEEKEKPFTSLSKDVVVDSLQTVPKTEAQSGQKIIQNDSTNQKAESTNIDSTDTVD